MKVQLVVVRGKPEGKVIPLVGPRFKIGRGETCHLRPNSEQVSREHAEFTISGEVVSRQRPGQPQRNAGQRQGADRPKRASSRIATWCRLGRSTFAVSILDAPATSQSTASIGPAAKPASPG